MKKLLGALALALFAQSANAQLAAEGLVIGLKRNEALAHIDKLSHGGARMVCTPVSESPLNEDCISSSITGLKIEGHAVKDLHMGFLAKRLDLLEVTFADNDLEPALASLLAQMSKKLGEPTQCPEEGGCEWERDGQGLLVAIMEPGNLTLVMRELEYDTEQGIWRYENQEFDDMYPVRERPTKSRPSDLSMR